MYSDCIDKGQTHHIHGFWMSVIAVHTSKWLIEAEASQLVGSVVCVTVVVTIEVPSVVAVVVQVSVIVAWVSIDAIEVVQVIESVIPDVLVSNSLV